MEQMGMASFPLLHPYSGSVRFEVELVKRALWSYKENHLSVCVQLRVELKNKYRRVFFVNERLQGKCSWSRA